MYYFTYQLKIAPFEMSLNLLTVLHKTILHIFLTMISNWKKNHRLNFPRTINYSANNLLSIRIVLLPSLHILSHIRTINYSLQFNKCVNRSFTVIPYFIYILYISRQPRSENPIVDKSCLQYITLRTR